MLFLDNTAFLDKCADVMRSFWGLTTDIEPLPDSVITSVSECCDMGWYVNDGEYIRWSNGLTIRNMLGKFEESAILWQALTRILGTNDQVTHRYMVKLGAVLPITDGDARYVEREISLKGNLFAGVVYPAIASLGRRGRKVSVSELISRLCRELGAGFDKRTEKLMSEIPLAEDAAYVWIRFSGYQPEITDVEDKETTAARIAPASDGVSRYEHLMSVYAQIMNGISAVPTSEEWLDSAFAAEGGSVSLEEYEKNVPVMPVDAETALASFKGIDGFCALYADAKRRCQNGAFEIKSEVINRVISDITCKINAALEVFNSAVSLDDNDVISAMEKGTDTLARLCAVVENVYLAHLSEPAVACRQESRAFESMLKRARAELKACRDIYSVIRAENELRQGAELRSIRRSRLLGDMHEIEEYVNTFEELRLDNAKSKDDVFEAMNDLKRRLDALDALYASSDSDEYGGAFHSEEGIYGIYDAIKKKAESVLNRINGIMDDPAVPDFSEGGVIDDSEWIYDLGDGAKARFVLVDESFNELVYEESSADKGFNFYDFNTYHQLTDSAIAVKRQPVFGDYPEFSDYAYFKPFRYQLDSVRTMLSRFEGRGVFGDQVGLGKTLQTVMAADVMFRCGSIANTVIVAREANIYQWRAEIERKFRNADGSQMFRLFPERGFGRGYYTVEELPTVTSGTDFNKRENALKIYFLSSESLQSREFADRIEDIAEKKAELARITEHVDSIPEGYPLDEESINSASNIDTLFFIKRAIYNKLLAAVSAEQELLRWEYRGIRYGFDDFDPKLDREVRENGEVRGRGFFPKLNEYNELIGLAASRMESMLLRRRQLKKAIGEFSLGAIGLLVFDEVQEIVDKMGSESGERRSASALREFIADTEKKYCILLSATPLKNDLSDIFQLLYMVDKERLGETREEAEENFYRIYCGGCRTLSDIANAPDREHKFKMLNGLINSIFTRKRVYDKDVVESLRRQCATAAERAAAGAHSRDDYGGERFEALMRALSVANEYVNCKDGDEASRYRAELASYSADVYGGFGITDDLFVTAMTDMSGYVTRAVAYEELKDGVAETMEDDGFDICKMLLEAKRRLKCAESVGDEEAALTEKRICDRLISRINRGLIEFYRAEKDYSAAFIADCLDWTRPLKRGAFVDGIKNYGEKTEAFVRILGGEAVSDLNIDFEDTDRLKREKVAFYDSSDRIGKAVYRALGGRRVYLNLTDADVESGELTAEDAVRLNFFGSGGRAKEISENALAEIRKKASSELTPEEERYLSTYGGGDTELTHGDINFINFTEFSAENGNWNSICFMDRAQTVGTDLNAAGVLCIGQLDDGNGEYMDPLDIEQLVGRVSRLGQTEECFILTCLYNGGEDGKELDPEFNSAYYDLLADPEGFDLFGAGMTEISFALPVVKACLKQMLSEPSKLDRGAIDEKPERDFTAEIASSAEDFNEGEDNFAEIFRYVFRNRNDIRVIEKTEKGVAVYEAVEGVKRLVRKYVALLSAQKSK